MGIAALAASLGLLAAPLAVAQTNTIATAGYWKAFAGKSNSGTPLCGMSATGKGLFFSIKVYRGDDDMTVQLGSERWKIKDGAKQKVVMRFDREAPWRATATGFHFRDGDAGLEFSVKTKNLESFLKDFAKSQKLRIEFEGSDVDGWTADLTGTAAVTVAFGNCVEKRL
ncbi:MAG: hypothetical protein FJX11_16325 [Alphaproteobacteria bacterium]|nr:hypothetical protein [Alphaproteobacteria bacterium]